MPAGPPRTWLSAGRGDAPPRKASSVRRVADGHARRSRELDTSVLPEVCSALQASIRSGSRPGYRVRFALLTTVSPLLPMPAQLTVAAPASDEFTFLATSRILSLLCLRRAGWCVRRCDALTRVTRIGKRPRGYSEGQRTTEFVASQPTGLIASAANRCGPSVRLVASGGAGVPITPSCRCREGSLTASERR